MYISCQTREGNLKNFFSQENQTTPPSLSENGHLWPAKSKSSIVKCIEGNEIHQQECPQVDSKISDGGALVNMLRPVNHRTFDDYAQIVVMTYIKNQLHPVKTADIVWDQYFPESLKEKTRNDHCTGVHRKVKPNGYLQNDWPAFLWCNETELLEFLSKNLIKDIDMDKCLVVMFDDAALTNQPIDVTDLAPCTIEKSE